MKSLCIVLPVLNEKLRLEKGVITTVDYLKQNIQNPWEILIVDNGSTDETPEIAQKLCETYPEIRYIVTKEKGVGLAFRTGLKETTCDLVGYMDIDLSTDICHLKQMVDIFNKDDKVDMVNASRWNKDSDTVGRKWYRNITSHGLTFVLKHSLHMKASDAICGFKFFKRTSVQRLVVEAGESENGWFYIIELLLRAERDDMKIVELPVRWQDDYNSKVKLFKVISNYIHQIIRLRKVFREEKRGA